MSVRNMNRDIPQTSDGVRSKYRRSKYQRSKNHVFELPHGQITRPSEKPEDWNPSNVPVKCEYRFFLIP